MSSTRTGATPNEKAAADRLHGRLAHLGDTVDGLLVCAGDLDVSRLDERLLARADLIAGRAQAALIALSAELEAALAQVAFQRHQSRPGPKKYRGEPRTAFDEDTPMARAASAVRQRRPIFD